MTSPVTPYAAIPYLEEGAPLYLMRQRVQAAMERLDAVLQTTTAAPPGAVDLAAVATRVGVLEADQAAEDSGRAVQAITFATGYAQYTTAPYGELLRCWKQTPDVVRVVGMVLVSTAVASGATAVTVATIPAGYRPAVTVNRTCWHSPGNVIRSLVGTTGALQVTPTPAGGLAVGNWLQFDLAYRLVNT